MNSAPAFQTLNGLDAKYIGQVKLILNQRTLSLLILERIEVRAKRSASIIKEGGTKYVKYTDEQLTKERITLHFLLNEYKILSEKFQEMLWELEEFHLGGTVWFPPPPELTVVEPRESSQSCST